MSITIYDSATRYATGTAQTALNDLAAAYNGWKSVTYSIDGDETSDVTAISVTDDILIDISVSSLRVTHTLGATATTGTSTSIYNNYRIITTDCGVMWHSAGSSLPSIAVGKINSTAKLGVVVVGTGSSGRTTPFTDSMAATSVGATNGMLITGSITQLVQAVSWSCTDVFDDIKIVLCRDAGILNSRAEINSAKYYIGAALALRYT